MWGDIDRLGLTIKIGMVSALTKIVIKKNKLNDVDMYKKGFDYLFIYQIGTYNITTGHENRITTQTHLFYAETDDAFLY